jgi:hypothetical protein
MSVIVPGVSDDLYINADVVMACADLASRTGASGFEIGHVHDDVPIEEAGWYAHVNFRGARIIVENLRGPDEAALALAQRLLTGATCRCLKPVSLGVLQRGCRWKLVGERWESGCDAPPIKLAPGTKAGDYGEIQRALANVAGNRMARRAAKKGRRGRAV